jgi:hypothetical protein
LSNHLRFNFTLIFSSAGFCVGKKNKCVVCVASFSTLISKFSTTFHTMRNAFRK